ncbi:MAG TPA: CaiB/BaiF CoA-transferase family protein [Trebonia sp.]
MGADLPLADLRVIDLTVARAGPNCVRQLADWGADVIRIDAPPNRTSGERRHNSDFQNLHRNKRSILLDLTTAEDKATLMRLVDGADILVENMRPGVKSRLGFGYTEVHQRNPRLVYGSISGFGQDGPYADRGAYDQIIQGMGGLMSVTGTDGVPARAGIALSDMAAGLYLAVGILVALHERDRTGVGRWVQTSLLESMVGMLDMQATRWTVDHEVPGQEGNHHPTLVPMGTYRSSDGYVNVAAPYGRLLDRFFAVSGLPGLQDDERFDSSAKRSQRREELNEIIGTQMRERTTAEWVAVLNDAGVPCGPVYRIDEMFADPQIEHLALTEPVEHPALGQLALVRNPVRMTGVGPTVRQPSPDLGEHSAQVLAELDLGTPGPSGERSALR